MPLTAAQTTAFFENADQMGIPHDTMAKLTEEGIASVGDLADFDKDTLDQVADNLRKPGDRIPNPDQGAAPGSTIPRPPYTFGAKSQKRLLEACDLIRYYDQINRPLTAANVQYNPIIKNFTEQWKALRSRRDTDGPEVPKITRTLPIIKWTEAFDDFLHRAIGTRTIPLAYVIRENEAVHAVPPPLMVGKPHSETHGSVEGELIARASHNHPLFRDDNSEVYYYLEEATRGTAYAASLKPYQRSKDGRAALASLRNQYAGRDKWEAELKRQDDLLHTRVWKGQSNFSLEKFIAQHRNAYVSMQQCAEHVDYQLPNEHTRVGYLMAAIQTSDAGLQAAMAQIQTDDSATGKRNNFEATASYLLPYDPVAKKRQTAAKKGASISDVTADVAAFGTKPGLGKTGVHLRYHTKEEYVKLSHVQKMELKEWRESNPTAAGKRSKAPREKSKPKDQSHIAAAVAREVAKQMPANSTTKQQDDSDVEAASALIMSLVKQANNEAQTHPPSSKKARFSHDQNEKPTVTASALKSILRRAKNGTDDQE